jgi:hypothetical protein
MQLLVIIHQGGVMSAIDNRLLIQTLEEKDPQELASKIVMGNSKELEAIFTGVSIHLSAQSVKKRYKLLTRWQSTLSLAQATIAEKVAIASGHPDIERRVVLQRMWSGSLDFIKVEAKMTQMQIAELERMRRSKS